MTDLRDQGGPVLDNHYVIRDGSFWICRNGCGLRIPFPSRMPDSATLGPCQPRTWESGEPEPVDGRAHPHGADGKAPLTTCRPRSYNPADGGPSAIDWPCPKCRAEPGERCRDGRRLAGTTMRPHKERR